MSDDGISMGDHFIDNQRVVTYNKFLGMEPMVLNAPWADFLRLFPCIQ